MGRLPPPGGKEHYEHRKHVGAPLALTEKHMSYAWKPGPARKTSTGRGDSLTASGQRRVSKHKKKRLGPRHYWGKKHSSPQEVLLFTLRYSKSHAYNRR